MTRWLALALACVVSAFAADGAQAAFLINESFETPRLNSGEGYRTFGPGTPNGSTVGGFTVGGTVDVVDQAFFGSPTPPDGTQFLDLKGTPGPGSVTQGFTTVVGQTYNLTFRYSLTPGVGSQTFTVTFGDAATPTTTPVTVVGAPDPFLTFTTTYTATSTAGTLQFLSDAAVSNQGPFLDLVQVSDGATAAVPAPASVLALAFGGGFFGLARRLRRGA